MADLSLVEELRARLEVHRVGYEAEDEALLARVAALEAVVAAVIEWRRSPARLRIAADEHDHMIFAALDRLEEVRRGC